MIITILDLVCLLLFVVAINMLIQITKVAIEEYKENTLQLREFAVEISNLPSKATYKTEKVLKAALWTHVE